MRHIEKISETVCFRDQICLARRDLDCCCSEDERQSWGPKDFSRNLLTLLDLPLAQRALCVALMLASPAAEIVRLT